jgi:hypothetical protein
MKSFKFFDKEEPAQSNLLLFNGLSTRFNPENVEFCFQFDDNEPVGFAIGPNECHINITPTHNGNMTFNDNGRVFKLFAREIENDSHI